MSQAPQPAREIPMKWKRNLTWIGIRQLPIARYDFAKATDQRRMELTKEKWSAIMHLKGPAEFFQKKKSINKKHHFIHPPKFLSLPREKILETRSFKKGTACFGLTNHWRPPRRETRELKQQRRRRRKRKRHLKSEFALLQTLSRLFHPVWFVKRW